MLKHTPATSLPFVYDAETRTIRRKWTPDFGPLDCPNVGDYRGAIICRFETSDSIMEGAAKRQGEADAAYLVQAGNLHPKLVAALCVALSYLPPEDEAVDPQQHALHALYREVAEAVQS